MARRLIPVEFSIVTITPQAWRTGQWPPDDSGGKALMLGGIVRTTRSHIFRDVLSGAVLWINTNHTFRLTDSTGYSSGVISAQQMSFAGNEVSVWHQDKRFSFTCHANLKTGFCFAWLIDRRYQKSCRILDPGRTISR